MGYDDMPEKFSSSGPPSAGVGTRRLGNTVATCCPRPSTIGFRTAVLTSYTSCVQGLRNSPCWYQSLRANPAFVRTRNSDSGRRPSALIPRLSHRDSMELVAACATSLGTTRFRTLPLEASRRWNRRRTLDGNRARTTLASHSAPATDGIY